MVTKKTQKDQPMAQSDEPRLVVGVGASAGGLDAFRQLLSALSGDTDLTLILIQHLDPSHKSHLAELLAPHTSMSIVEATQGLKLQANTVYLLRPGTALAVREGRLVSTDPAPHRRIRFPVDHLFRSLAREYGPRAVGLILSGAGNDGSAGLRDVKAAGGLTIAQDPSTSSQTGMPQNAIDTGLIDLVLSISAMPEALLRFESLLSSPQEPESQTTTEGSSRLEAALTIQDIEQIAAVLETQAGFDLQIYKPRTVERRVLRRMLLTNHNVASYLALFKEDQAEQQALIRDLLISVTEFFRDPEAFEALRTVVIEPLVSAAKPDETLRVWVPGCASGEEAYSIAIEFLEAIERSRKRISLQLFATDVDQEALAIARAGIYSPAMTEYVRPEYLSKYFRSLNGKGYQVRSQLRDTISFSVHDLTKNPPFSRMHLVSCRNVLIYLRSRPQENVLRVLHFALLPDGYLFLGASESVGPQRELYATASKKWRIFRKVGISRPLTDLRSRAQQRAMKMPGSGTTMAYLSESEPKHHQRLTPQLGELARRVVMQSRVPPTIVIAESGAILFMHGELRPYLRFPDGEPRLELTSLVTPELATRVRAALYKCRREQKTVVAFSSPELGRTGRTRLTATPAFELGDNVVVLSFEDVPEEVVVTPSTFDSPSQELVIEQLERELLATQEDLRNTVDELESSNEELRATNEESMSMNEELQAANEELEATTEELRSLNEELTTVNAQLREKVELLEQAHDDITNFFASTKIATLFLDEQLRIKRFTPAAAELIRIEYDDTGRFIGDIARELLQKNLPEEAREVLEHLASQTRQLHTQDGRWITRRVLPYRTENQRIEGVVVTFTDVTNLKKTTEQLSRRERQQAVIARLGIRALEDPDLQTFLDQTVREIQQTLETDYCKVLELQPGGNVLLLRSGVGWQKGLVLQATVSSDLSSQAGFTLTAREPVIVDDLAKERRFNGPSLLFEHGVISGMSCIIRGGSEPYGVLGVHTRQHRTFTREDANFLQAVASVIAGAINRHGTRTRLALESATAKELAEAESLQDAVARFHKAAAEVLGGGIGELWEPREADQSLERTANYTSSLFSTDQLHEQFLPSRFGKTEGLIGRVFSQHRAEWLSSLQEPRTFVRVKAAQQLGLQSGLALPIMSGSHTLGVVTYFSQERIYVDDDFLRSVESIGRWMGDLVKRIDLERRFRMTINSAPVGIADRSVDGRWLRVNDCLCQITGYAREELVSLPYTQLSHPDDLQRELSLDTALREKRSDRYSLAKRFIRKDGTTIWVNVSVAVVTKPCGEPDYHVVVIEDISARKHAEEKLRDSQARFRQVLLRSPVPMMLYDEHGNVLALSDSWTTMSGYSAEEIPTVDAWFEKAYRDRYAEMKKLMQEIWTDYTLTRQYEKEIWTKAGEKKTLMLTGVFVGKTINGRRMRVIVAADVTQQRRFERELLKASRQKDEFIAMLGHELRNPLSTVRYATELLKQTIPKDDELAQHAQAVLERQTSHMAKLLDGLLDISRIVRGKIEMDKKIIDLRAIIHDVLSDHTERLKTAGLELHAELGAAPIWLEGDAVRLSQVVDNLLTNAEKYTPGPGIITVRLTRDGDVAKLTISDTGQGIEPELLPTLFDIFQQGRQSLDRAQGGLGLGLALVKLLTELHGGSVEAQSEGLHQGAEFIVRLPITQKAPAIPLKPISNGRAHHILLIEDNEDSAEMLRKVLEVHGHQVTVALRGTEGIELARELIPDVVFCDLGLPDGITGFDVATTLRKDPRTQNLLLVAISGYGRPEDKQRSQESGFNAHLTKPVSLEAIEQTLQEFSQLEDG